MEVGLRGTRVHYELPMVKWHANVVETRAQRLEGKRKHLWVSCGIVKRNILIQKAE